MTPHHPAPGRRQRPFFRRIEHASTDPARANPTPAGWVAEPVGAWGGHETEVVYDPRRHSVMLVTGPRAEAEIEGGLAACGWERRARDGGRTLWIRDRLAVTQAALTRLDDRPHGVDPEAAVDVAGAGRPIRSAAPERLTEPPAR